MDFLCVLSVSGSLAYYQVQKESGEAYKAILRTNNGRRDDIPAEISLQKNASGWQATPPHPEIVQGLIQAIESNSR